jgi:hypothetical protein
MSSVDSSSVNQSIGFLDKNVPATAEPEVVSSHKAIFNRKAFTLNPDLTVDTEPSKTSRHLSHTG